MKKPTPFGKYFLLERINVGGMAEVFRAKAFGVEGFERLVAVKRILPNIAEDKEFIRMFIEEAKLSVQLNHANIAQIFDLGVVDGAYYIALEHIHGRDLRGIFDRGRNLGEPMPVAQACFIAMKVCEGLDYAHNKRDQAGRELSLVHRDVSPQNMLVSFEGEVKLIDFGIAKAAGKGSKTQAGILKGKFGYMSPEQVRGLPVDRRSDVFSCGIVLYELLTGERLFVGESDFSTLEKVRNVEILPPSTYNRKIPDELERIVLKALAKDVEDRYQNAIDLHDELQAFVYTAGEFYSRKDLAGWMKKTFAKEIEEETAKLESYRQLKPPPSTPEPPRAATGSKAPGSTAPPPPRKSTQSIPVVGGGTKPPPPPTRMTGQMAAVGAVKMTGQMAAVAAPAAQSSGKLSPVSLSAASSSGNASVHQDPTDLAWDDDELETQIYDDPTEDPKSHKSKAKALPLQAPMHTPSPHMVAASSPNDPTAMAPAVTPSPDLSSLAHTAKGWEKAPATSPPPPLSPSATLNGIGMITGTNGVVPKLATGSNNTVTPLEPPPATSSQLAVTMVPAASGFPFDQPRESQVSQRLVATEAPNLFDPMASFGANIAARKPVGQQKNFLWIAGGGIAIAAVAVVLVIVLSNSSDKSKTAQANPPPPTSAPNEPASTNPSSNPAGTGTGDARVLAATSTGSNPTNPGSNPSNQAANPPPPSNQVGDQNTGFDLYVSPAGVTQWHLDGETRTDRLPSRIRGIAPGVHTVAIDAPPGFVGGSQQVPVESGKAGKIEIALQPIDNLMGVFDSTPPGAEVSLIVDGKRQALGSSPTKSKLDPRNTYQVLFEKPGYVSVNRPIVFTGSTEEKLVVILEKASPVAVDRPRPTPPVNRPTPAPTPRQTPVTTPDKTTDKVADKGTTPDKTTDPSPAGGGMGTLRLGSKPPCEIYVDGSAAGFSTPHPVQVAAGKHRITLVNNEFGIKETFNVDVKADSNELVRKDFSDRLPK